MIYVLEVGEFFDGISCSIPSCKFTKSAVDALQRLAGARVLVQGNPLFRIQLIK